MPDGTSLLERYKAAVLVVGEVALGNALGVLEEQGTLLGRQRRACHGSLNTTCKHNRSVSHVFRAGGISELLLSSKPSRTPFTS